MVVVELYGLPRQRGGADRVELRAGPLHQVLRALAAALPGLVPDMLAADGRLGAHALLALDGRELLTDPETVVPDGAVLVMISAQAGG